ncbi:response regulator transcription factor [Sinorhizobium saheli]|jgi:two-component system phosphate regulon response regulator PhoB|uniref:Response regulator n=1 Tax=Sinorhizobium saheli TaxID=36856 RepID=A0A178YKI4_SINSA|nr:response regulator transcription factor [Sinorhizobium saheli]MQW86986.1 DNA-binding response regulator [Sinorhizobium saheli]OAP48002.1 response regulator [Sinorhizobium saheli]
MKAQHTKPLVLICSDDANFYVLLAYILAREGFQAALVSEDEVADQAATRPVTAIILVTGEDSGPTLRACAAIKASDTTAHIPTIAVVSSGDERYYLALLKAGADENFVRPISPARLLAYLGSLPRAHANDARLPDADMEETRTFGQLRIEPGRRIVEYGDEEAQFGPIEFNLLRCFLEAPGRVRSRSELIAAAWPPDRYVQPRTVDVHVGRLRRSLERLTGRTLIRTVRATGYAIEVGGGSD